MSNPTTSRNLIATMIYFWIALGSALGGVARFWASTAMAARFGGDYPLGTVLVNLTGCFAIGLFAGLTAPNWPPPRQLQPSASSS